MWKVILSGLLLWGCLNPDNVLAPTLEDSVRPVGVGVHRLEDRDVASVLGLHSRVVRNTLYWDLAERDPVHYSAWQAGIRRATRAGLHLIVVVHGSPQEFTWENRDTGYQAFASFMARVVQENPDVFIWELWNEQNVGFTPLFGAGRARVSMEERGAEYARMLSLVAPRIRQENPHAAIVVGGTAGSPTDQQGFYRGLYRVGAGKWFDAANVHTYSVPLEWSFIRVGEAVRSVMDENGDRCKPLVNTEFGISGGNLICAWDVKTTDELDRLQREEIRQVVEWNEKNDLYDLLVIYQLVAGEGMEECERSRSFPARQGDYGFGLLRDDGITPRPSYQWVSKYNESIPPDGTTVIVPLRH